METGKSIILEREERDLTQDAQLDSLRTWTLPAYG